MENTDAPDASMVQATALMQIGENETPEYTDEGLGSNVLALSTLTRKACPDNLVGKIIETGSPSEIADLFILLFATRNTRGGKGEKRLAHAIFCRILQDYPETSLRLLALFPHYGYWKDLLLLLQMLKESGERESDYEMVKRECIMIMSKQLNSDIKAFDDYEVTDDSDKDSAVASSKQSTGPKISLLAKWLPREGSSFDNKLDFVIPFAEAMWPDLSHNDDKSYIKSKYRKAVSKLTASLVLPEVLLAAKREEEINFARIASKATLLLRKVFMNEDKSGKERSDNPKRIKLSQNFYDYMLKHGLKGTQVFPHEIVQKIFQNRKNISDFEARVFDAQWTNMWQDVVTKAREKAEKKGMAFNPTRMVPLADVSGSMSGTPMMVSIAMAIGISEITHPAFSNMVLTFSSEPEWHLLNEDDNIVQKTRSLEQAQWGYSTNFAKAYDKVLDVALQSKLSREDLPTLIVFSDMQFDVANHMGNWDTMYQTIRERTEKVGRQLEWTNCDPTPIIFWNLRSTGGHPVEKDTPGTVLLSGFSPSLLKLVLQGDVLEEQETVQADGTVVKRSMTPIMVLRKMLDDELYDPVRSILYESQEKELAKYVLPNMSSGQ
jgi:Domain of unknown function (DUF2828)